MRYHAVLHLYLEVTDSAALHQHAEQVLLRGEPPGPDDERFLGAIRESDAHAVSTLLGLDDAAAYEIAAGTSPGLDFVGRHCAPEEVLPLP